MVLNAARLGDLREVMRDEVETAELLGLPPFRFRCEISGENAQRFIDSLATDNVNVRVTNSGFEVSANEVEVLSEALATGKHPGGRLRIARN
jgi:hypothetical protein